MTALIAGTYGFFRLMIKRNLKAYSLMVLVFTLCMIVPFSLRFFENEDIYDFTMTAALEAGRGNKLNPGQLWLLENDKFYGISPAIMGGFPYELSLLACAVAIFYFKRDKTSAYLLASFAVLALATIPYTGWLIGLAVTPFQLWRLTWLMPFGIAMAYLVKIVLAITTNLPVLKRYRAWIRPATLLLTQIALVAGMIYILPWAKGNLGVGGRKPGFTRWYQEYIQVGEVLNTLEPPGALIVGGPDRPTNDIIPSLSYNVRLISFRNERGGNTAPLWEALIGEGTDPEERLNLMQEHQVEYLLIREEHSWLNVWLERYSHHAALLFENDKLRLYQLNFED
jgi:hypothetical protein